MNIQRVINYLSNNICKKSVVYQDTYTFLHTKQLIIVPNHWLYALHEIAHWIVCDENEREKYNLGLPEVGDESKCANIYRMYSEECMALLVTKWLYYRLIYNVCDEYGRMETVFNIYEYEARRKAYYCNADYDKLWDKANVSLNKYVGNIRIVGNLIIREKSNYYDKESFYRTTK